MPVINHRRFAKPHRRSHVTRKRLCWGVGVLAMVFLAGNLLLAAVYYNKALPRTHLGSASVGGMRYAALQKLPGSTGIESSIQLQNDGISQKVMVRDLGVSTDMQASARQLRAHWSRWMPLVGLMRGVTVPVVLRVDQPHFKTTIDAVAPQFEKAPQDIHVGFTGQRFAQLPASDGVAVRKEQLLGTVRQAVAAGTSVVHVPTAVVKPVVHNTDLSAAVTFANKQLGVQVSFARFGGPKIVPSTAQKAAWFAPDGQSVALSAARMGDYLDTVAAQQKFALLNKDDLVTAATYALSHQQSLDFRLVTQGNHLRTYCTAVRGVSETGLADLNGKLAAVYADARGWNADGTLAFKHVEGGCQYTVWLAAPSTMSSFGAICDDYYNCQVGNSVVVNSDRWTQATPAWNSTGNSLENYRILIIDHETGHRLGFVDNPVCPAAGGAAPVMMQQSIDLHGCTFNVWPTPAEISQVKSML